MADTAYLSEVAAKFGLTDKKVLRRAGELLKLLATQKGLTCSESCKVTVCLDLASQLITCADATISKEKAIRFSGCKKSVYLNNYNIISKMLNLDKSYSVKELCVTLGISELEASAVGLFAKYKLASGISDDDTQHPMYASAAVMAASKCNEVKINSAKLVEISRLKKGEFEKLVQKMEECNVQEKRTKRLLIKDEMVQARDEVTPHKKTKKKSEEEIEAEYQAWKKRMLMEE